MHFRLLRRISAICLLAMLFTAAALLYLEYHRLADTMLRDAEHQSRLFAGVIKRIGSSPETLASEVSDQLLSDILQQSSFIQTTVTATDQRTLFSGDREDGAARAAAFAATTTLPSSPDAAVGRLHVSGNRFYQQVVTPLHDPQSQRVIGYLDGVYRLSLDDTTSTLRWTGLTVALACAALAACGLLLYPAILLLQRHLIAGSSEAHRAAGFLLKRLARTLAAADTATSEHHQHRLAIYSVSLAKQQGVARTTIRGLVQAAFLSGLERHGLPAEALGNQAEQQDRSRKQLAAAHKRLLKEIKRYRWLHEAEPIVRSCHEHYDGTGYPAGLSGQAIPVGARILAIVQHFDALTVPGPKRDPVDLATGLRSIEQESGTRFDPVLVSAFVDLAPSLFAECTSLDESQLERRVDGTIAGYLPF